MSDRNETAAFLSILFKPADLVLYRPIETWKERGRHHSRVIYPAVTYRQPGMKDGNNTWCHSTAAAGATLAQLDRIADREKANLFFGCCPRFGADGKFDLAWQVRVVRFLWCDIDSTTPEAALAECKAAGVPRPTAVVASGHGAHFYWLLSDPYHIDDCDDPLPVQTEFISNGDGKKKPHKFIVGPDGERYELQQAMRVLDECRLSAKGEHLQDVLAGIAEAIGGDHTTDLSRLLRLPGTLNRKNERIGTTPVPCQLFDLDPARRHDFAKFERFAVDSPTVKRRAAVAAAPLPTPRKMTAARKDKLGQLTWECETAPVGQRSEKDFSLICWAIEHGHSQGDVWSVVGATGKFAERGEEYFARTWAKAEQHTRENIFDKLTSRKSGKKKPVETISPKATGDDAPDGDGEDGERPRIVFDPVIQDVADLVAALTDTLLDHGDVYQRAEQPVVVQGDALAVIEGPGHLAGLLLHRAEFCLVDGDTAKNEPLPYKYGSVWLRSPAILERLPVVSMFTRNPVFSEDDRLIAPGYDSSTGIYYMGPAVEPRDGTTHLDDLLADFCFREPADRANFLGVLLTVLLMPRFIGAKPAVIFNGNQSGLGKTLLAQIIAILRDGGPVETTSYNKNDEEFEKKIGSLVRKGVTTIIIDNAKSKIDSPCLERCLTDHVLSFRLLGSSATISAENSHIFAITANVIGAGRDIVTRALPVNLDHEGDPLKREFSIQDPEGYVIDHRIALLGELIGMVERWKAAGRPLAPPRSRFDKRGWSTVVGGILQAAGEEDFLANLERAAREFDPVGADFAELVEIIAKDPRGWWSPAELVTVAELNNLLAHYLGNGSARSKAVRMGIVAVGSVEKEFPLTDATIALFHKRNAGNRPSYQVEIK